MLRLIEKKHGILKKIISDEISLDDEFLSSRYDAMTNTAKTKNELMDDAKKIEHMFDDVCSELRKYGDISDENKFKSFSSLNDKIERYKKYMKFNNSSVSENLFEESIIATIHDAIRCTLTIENPKDVQNIVSELMRISSLNPLIEIGLDNKWKKNNSVKPFNTGYVSLHLFVRFKFFKNGIEKFVVGEIQVQFQKIKNVANQQHKLYQEIRNFEPSTFTRMEFCYNDMCIVSLISFSNAILGIVEHNKIKISWADMILLKYYDFKLCLLDYQRLFSLLIVLISYHFLASNLVIYL